MSGMATTEPDADFAQQVAALVAQGYNEHEATIAVRLENGDTLDPNALDAFVGDDDAD